MPLRTNQQNAIPALLATSNLGDAAELTGVSERTLARWLSEDAEFSYAVRKAQDAALADAVRKLGAATGLVIDTLLAIVTDPNARDSTRVNAARVALAESRALREQVSINERLTELELAMLVRGN